MLGALSPDTRQRVLLLVGNLGGHAVELSGAVVTPEQQQLLGFAQYLHFFFWDILYLILHLLAIEPKEPLIVCPQLFTIEGAEHVEVVTVDTSNREHLPRLQGIIKMTFMTISTSSLPRR